MSTVYTSDPTILGTAALADGKVAVLAGFAGTSYFNSSSYNVFDKLQVAIVAPGGLTTLSSTGLVFPAGDSPDGRPNPAGGGAIATLTSGKIAVLTWGGSSANYDITVLNSDGSVDTPAFVVGNATTSNPGNPHGAVAAMPGGGYVIVWNANDVQQTYMQIYDSSNRPIGSRITVASVPGPGTGWSGSLAVDGQGNIILAFGTGNVSLNSTYKLYNSSGQLIANGTTQFPEYAPVFVGLTGGGFEAAGFQPIGHWNNGYSGYNLVIDNVSAAGSLSTVATVANASPGSASIPLVSSAAINASGEVVFQELGHTAYDTLVGLTITRDAISPSTPGLALSTSPSGNALSGSNAIVGAAVSGSNIVGESLIDPACFMAGTQIATPHGVVAVEGLRPGDLVMTTQDCYPVRWIGRSTVSTRFGDPLHVLPIRIKAEALGDRMPIRDLLLSPEHAIMIDGILVQAGALVNGTSIIREYRVPETFVYYHVECAQHVLLMAEGVQAESFVDNIGRRVFDNWMEYETTYGDSPIAEMPYPRAQSHRQVPIKIRAKLNARAQSLYGPGIIKVA